jgi:hypothetical protein
LSEREIIYTSSIVTVVNPDRTLTDTGKIIKISKGRGTIFTFFRTKTRTIKEKEIFVASPFTEQKQRLFGDLRRNTDMLISPFGCYLIHPPSAACSLALGVCSVNPHRLFGPFIPGFRVSVLSTNLHTFRASAELGRIRRRSGHVKALI